VGLTELVRLSRVPRPSALELHHRERMRIEQELLSLSLQRVWHSCARCGRLHLTVIDDGYIWRDDAEHYVTRINLCLHPLLTISQAQQIARKCPALIAVMKENATLRLGLQTDPAVLRPGGMTMQDLENRLEWFNLLQEYIEQWGLRPLLAKGFEHPQWVHSPRYG